MSQTMPTSKRSAGITGISVRVIGVRHQRKVTTEGEPRPTELCILEDGQAQRVLLETEDDELAFVKTACQTTDTYAMVLGGSGDALAVAFARHGATVMRIPSFLLKQERGNADKDDDAELLAKLAVARPELFYVVSLRDQAIIRVAALWQLCEKAMQARIACGNRLQQRLVGRLLMDEGEWPEGKFKDLVKAVKANDGVYQALDADEHRYLREMTKELERLDVYTQLFQPLEGIGPKIAARIIAAVQDIRRFPTVNACKAYCGLHVGPEGQFVRRRHGQVANYSPVGRQAFYLLTDQFNRRPKSIWGAKLLENKRRLREKHPTVEEVEKNGRKVKRYSDGHILKMAMWRTVTQFAVWLYFEWWKLEGGWKAPVAEEVAGQAAA